MEGLSPKYGQVIAGKKILVVGAGIGGLTFILALQKQWSTLNLPLIDFPDVQILERDAKKTSIEREGYSLSIRSDKSSGGMQALQKLGLLDETLANSFTGLTSTGSFALWDVKWNTIFRMTNTSYDKSLPVGGMRIARHSLRKVLVDAALKHYTIQWSSPCAGLTQLSNSKLRLSFEGQEVECDILIAADGAHSKIRNSLRPNDQLCFAGATCISGTARFPDGQIPSPVNKDWGFVIGGDGVGLFVSPIDQKSAVWSLSYLSENPREKLQTPFSDQIAKDVLQETLDQGKSFNEPFPSLVKATDIRTMMVFNAMDKQPFQHHLEDGHTPVVFIGDSSHAMSPFAGNGANLALMDGCELAEKLCKCDSLRVAIEEYDKSSIPRSKSAIRMSHMSISIAHAQGWRLSLYILFLRVMSWIIR